MYNIQSVCNRPLHSISFHPCLPLVCVLPPIPMPKTAATPTRGGKRGKKGKGEGGRAAGGRGKGEGGRI